MTNLELFTVEELIGELFKRFDHAIFAAQVKHSTEADQEIFRANGNRRLCQGLCQGMSSMIDRLHQDEARPVLEEETDHDG